LCPGAVVATSQVDQLEYTVDGGDRAVHLLHELTDRVATFKGAVDRIDEQRIVGKQRHGRGVITLVLDLPEPFDRVVPVTCHSF